MSVIDIKVPSLGESETEATLVSWQKNVGDEVQVDDVIAEIESDKITMEVTATHAGILQDCLRDAEDIVAPGEVIGHIDSSLAVTPKQTAQPAEKEVSSVQESIAVADDNGVALHDETISDVVATDESSMSVADRMQERVPMTRLRKRIAEHLKDAQNTAAMLTTFNEVNLQQVMQLRNRYKDAFKAKHGASLGFMSFFVKACVYAASKYPVVNARIDGDDVLYHNYMDVGVAVSTDKGLVVPVLRDAGMMRFDEIEAEIVDLASRARGGGLLPADLQGGTFSITNGGVFGSMLSTPILHVPQSAILGMHSIQKRVVVEDDEMVIRPMMYLALTYDHRLIDGKDAVQFLVAVKEWLENPALDLLDL